MAEPEFVPPASSDADIHFDFTAPAPVFGIDLIQKFTGVDIGFVLEPIYRPGERPETRNGQVYYPLRLPQGEEFTFSLRSFGALGFKNIGGYLAVYLPTKMQASWEERVRPEYRSAAKEVKFNGVSCVAYVLTLPPGIIATIQLPAIGFLGIRMGRPPAIAPRSP